jgi:hypothetical protein
VEKTTLVAFYGAKPDPLRTLIEAVQERAASLLPGFAARPMAEIHSTLIGLETPIRQVSPAEVDRFIDHVRTSLDRCAMVLQFGAFVDRDYALRSRGRRLYDRSFLVNGESVVLIGWPIEESSGEFVPALDTLRRSFQDFGFRHRYHTTPTDSDPDSYLVIGSLTIALDADRVTAAESDIRRFLSASSAVRVPLRSTDISVVRYEEPGLAEPTSRVYPLTAIGAGWAAQIS